MVLEPCKCHYLSKVQHVELASIFDGLWFQIGAQNVDAQVCYTIKIDCDVEPPSHSEGSFWVEEIFQVTPLMACWVTDV